MTPSNRGRPKSPADQVKSRQICLGFTEPEFTKISQLADTLGLKPGVYLRGIITTTLKLNSARRNYS